MAIEPPSFSTDLPPVASSASDGKNEEKINLPFCSDDIVIDKGTSGDGGSGDSPQNCIPKELESELDDTSSIIIDLDDTKPQVYNYPTPATNPFLLPRRPPAPLEEEDDREKFESIDDMPPCYNQNGDDIDLRIPGITCRISIVVNEPSESG